MRSVRSVIPVQKPSEQKPSEERTAEAPPVNEVLVLGDLHREIETARKLARELPTDADHYGGNLRIVLSALRRAADAAESLVENYYDA